MKNHIVLFLFIIASVTLSAQSITADSAHCTFVDVSTKATCSVNDTLFVDIDKNGSTDIKIWKYFDELECFNGYQYLKGRETVLTAKTSEEYKAVGAYISFFPVVDRVNYGQIIDTSTFHAGGILYCDGMLGYHCQFVEVGWPRNNNGYMLLINKNHKDIPYFMLKIRIFSDGQCIQVVPPSYNVVFSNLNDHNKLVDMYINNDRLIVINMTDAGSRTVRIYNASGALQFSREIYNMQEEIDMSRFESGFYLVSITDRTGNVETCKIVK